mmetsp:Transcript_17478/g.39204  ORF Transcript_17478/g.39204 Transcript_17478/m.39204 type:complete len:205 (-) Transcript_17478:156-770(-)
MQHLFCLLDCFSLLKETKACLQLRHLASGQPSRHVRKPLNPPLIPHYLDRLQIISRSQIRLACSREVVAFLSGRRLPLDQLLHLLRVGGVRELPRLFPPPQVGEHLDRTLHAVRLAEELGSFLELSLVREHRRHQYLVVVPRLLPLRLDSRYELDPTDVLQPCKRLSRNVELQGAQRIVREQPPVPIRHPQASDLVGIDEIALL